MNEMPETVQKAPEAEDQLTAIDALRTSIEQEHMFKTGFSGYNKQEVQKYLKELSENFKKATQEQNDELKRLEKENAQLCALIDEQKEKLANVRAEERRKLQAEYNLQEGTLQDLREKNSKLMSDNRALQVELSALREQLGGVRTVVSERSAQLDVLSGKLEELLAGKLKEFTDIIDVWKTEFRDIVAFESSRISEEASKTPSDLPQADISPAPVERVSLHSKSVNTKGGYVCPRPQTSTFGSTRT